MENVQGGLSGGLALNLPITGLMNLLGTGNGLGLNLGLSLAIALPDLNVGGIALNI